MKPIIYTVEDITQAMRLNYARRYLKKRIWLFGLVEALLLLFLINTVQTTFDIPRIFISFVALVALPGIVWMNWSSGIPIGAKRLFQSSKMFSETQYVTWDDKHLFAQMDSIDSKSAWSIYLDLLENEELMLLYSEKTLFHIYPKRFFESPEELADFRRHAEAGIASPKK